MSTGDASRAPKTFLIRSHRDDVLMLRVGIGRRGDDERCFSTVGKKPCIRASQQWLRRSRASLSQGGRSLLGRQSRRNPNQAIRKPRGLLHPRLSSWKVRDMGDLGESGAYSPCCTWTADKFRTSSLLDIAFWDYGGAHRGTMWQRWFGSQPEPATPAAGPKIEAMPSSSKGGSPSTAAGSHATWSGWLFGTK